MADQIVVDGESYEIADHFDMRELYIIEQYTQGQPGRSIAQLCGIIHVSIRRKKPDVPFDEIQEVVWGIDPDDLEALEGGQSPPAEKTSGEDASSNGDSGPSSDMTPDSENPSDTGSPDLATGFRSFHATSTTSPRRS